MSKVVVLEGSPKWGGNTDLMAEAFADTCAGATVADGLSLAQGDLPGAYDDIAGWIPGLAL